MRLPIRGIWRQLAIALLILGLPAALRWLPVMPAERVTTNDADEPRSSPPSDNGTDENDNEPQWPDRHLVKQSDKMANLNAYANNAAANIIPTRLLRRPDLLVERTRLRNLGDVAGVARLNAVLSTEAFDRAARVTTRWLDRRDPASGLFPHTLRPKDRFFSYGDVGADLYPFLAIATQHLMPQRFPEILTTLTAEHGLSAGFPRDVWIDTLQPIDQPFAKQMLNNVEYAKDGLLPMLELLGPDPWLPRLREIVDDLHDQSRVPTPAGAVPSDAAEVNGSLLQVLARLSWLSDNPRDLAMGRRIASAYLDHALPKTGYIPPEHWDFVNGTALDKPNLHLGDHGDEIVSGLIEWQRVETMRGLPEQAAHRAAINRMLDRLLETGRTPTGLWYDGIAFPSGNVVDRTLNDNWGYLGQAYLNQAAMLRTSPNADPERAARYEEAVATMLHAASNLDFYPWERGDMDGYADSLESALYLLHRIDDQNAALWVDEQMPVLYGYQRADGSVTDENIDGNFIRTVMLYGRWLTQGTRVEPWAPTVALGAVTHGPCLHIHLHTATPWSGRLLFDTPRHRAHLGLGLDYPRLNEWQEWWIALPDRQYAVTLPDGSHHGLRGEELAAGLALTLDPDKASQLIVCGT
jgi:hypothetical protein